MDLFTRDQLQELLTDRDGPCVSLFLPTHRGGSEQDPIRWRKLIRQGGEVLAATGMRASTVRDFLEPARSLLEDPVFWQHQCDGLAFYLAPSFLRLYRLPLTFTDEAVVDQHFHLRPLLPLLTGDGLFYVLALSQNAVRLFQATRHAISTIDLRGVPASLAEALLTHDVDEPLTYHTRPAGGLGSWTAVYNGHGVGIDDHKDDLLRYFQRIDRGLHPILRPDRIPLVLAAVDYLMPIYREANTYPHLLAQGVEGNPDRLSPQELHDRAWPLVRSHFALARENAIALYRQIAGTGRTATGMEEVLPAAYRGEAEVLYIPEGARRWGRFEPANQRVEEHLRAEAGDEDLLDTAATHTLRHGGTVYVVEPEEVAGTQPVAVLNLPLPRR
jgi:hypothetical protein